MIRKSGHKSKTPVKGSDLSAAKAKAANMSMLNMSFGKDRQIQGTPLHTSKSTYDELSRMLMFKTGSKKGKIKNKPTMSDYLGYRHTTSRNKKSGLKQPSNTKNSFITAL